MSTMPGDTPGGAGRPDPTEEELRAAYEAEMRQLRIEHLLLEHVVARVNLGMRRTGLSPGTEGERDPGQVRLAIESIRVVMPLLEEAAPEQVGQGRSARWQLQLAFVKIGGAPAQAAAGAESQPADAGQSGAGAEPGEPGEPEAP